MKIYILLALLVLSTQPIYAMHIMEGYLPLGWCLFWYAVSLPFLVVSYRHIKKMIQNDPRQRVTFALNTAFVFVLSALKLPSVTGSSSHLTGTTLGTLTSGVMSMPLVGLIVLLFQALLLAHGGISTLGANVFSLAVAGPLVAYFIYRGMMRLGIGRSVAVFMAACLGSLATYVTTSLQLAVVFPDASAGVWGAFLKFMGIFSVTQIPLSLLEGAMTLIVLTLIERTMSEHAATSEGTPSTMGRNLLLGTMALICLVLPVLGGYVDFGEGSDDRAGAMVSSLSPSYDASPFFVGYEPSEVMEPWLFAVQVFIGIVLFIWGWRMFARKP